MRDIIHRSIALIAALMIAFSSVTMNGTLLVYATEPAKAEEEVKSGEVKSEEVKTTEDLEEDLEEVSPEKELKADGEEQEQEVPPSTDVDIACSISTSEESNVVKTTGDTAYFDKLNLTVAVSPNGEADKILSVELLNQDKKSLGKLDYKDEDISQVVTNFPITESVKEIYAKVITKDLPNGVEKDVKSLISDFDGVDLLKYAPDGVSISVNEEETTVKVKEVNGINYITDEGILVEDISSDAPLEADDVEVEVLVDGKKVDGLGEVSANAENTEDLESYHLKYTLDVSAINGDKVEVKLKAKDLLGRGLQQDAVLVLNRNKYDVSVSGVESESEVVVSGDKTTVDDGITITLTASGSIKSLEVMKDGNSFKDLGTTGGSFDITESGEYLVKVVDVLDNEVFYNLQGLKGGEGKVTSLIEVIVDSSTPEVSIEVSPEKDWHNSLPSVTVTVSDDKLASYEVYLNGTTIKTGNTSESTLVDISGAVEGTNTITVDAKNKAGNIGSTSKSFNLDTKIGDVTATVDKTYNVSNKVAYFKENPKVTLSGIENGATCELDGTKVNTTFALSKTGNNTLTVTDKAGNKKSYSLSSLLGFDTRTYVIDNKAPVLKEQFEVSVSDNNKKWYSKKNPGLYYEVTEDNVDTIEATVNGKSSSLNMTDSGVVQVPTNDVVEGKNTVLLKVTDLAGNSTTSSTYTFYVDTVAPKLGVTKINPSGTGTLYEDGSHFMTNPTVTLSWEKDDGIGVKEFRINSESLTSSASGTAVKRGLGTGTYVVSVVDKFDRVTSADLGNTFGEGNNWKKNAVIVDGSAPGITLTNKEQVEKSGYRAKATDPVWLSAKPDLNYSVVDDNINTIEVKVNDSESYGVTSSTFTVNKDNMVEGSNTVVVTAKDKAGHESKDTYNFKIDLTKPVVASNDIGGNQYSEATYFKSKPSISLASSTDKLASKLEGSGIAGYYISYSNDISKSGNFSLDSGSYKFKAVDNVGNESAWVELKDLQGWKVCTTNDIIVDTTAPVIARSDSFKGDVVVDNSIWFGEKPSLTYTVTDDYLDNNLVVIKTNSGSSTKGSNKPSANKADMSEGTNTVTLNVSDKAGNTARDTYTFKLDLTKPTVKAANIGGEKYPNEATYFRSKPALDLSSSMDGNNGSGIKGFILDGSPIQEKNRFTLDSGSHTIIAVDKVGHQSDAVTLGSLMGWLGTNSIIVDTTNPSLRRVSGFTPTQISGINWFNRAPSLVYNAQDTNLLDITYTLNGTSHTIKADSTGNVTIPTSVFAEYIVNNITLRVRDKALNEVNDNLFSFKWDGTAPTFTGGRVVSSEQPKIYGSTDNVYFKANPTIQLSATDNGNAGVGIKNYSIGSVSSNSGEFSIGAGAHTATVTDLLNNTSQGRSLASLLGWNALNNIIIDNTAPTIEILGIKPALKDGDGKEWYATKPSLSVRVSDPYLRNLTVTVTRADGTSNVVTNVSANGTYDVSLDTVGDGRVTIEARAEDKATNSSKAGYTFYLDRTAPTGLDGTVDQSFIERDTGTFFKKTPTLSLTAKDAGVGVNKFYLDNNSSNTSGRFALSNGSHTVYVDDRLGNRTNAVAVNNANLKSLGFSNSRVVTDGVNPVITCSRPAGDVDGWYAKDQTFNATITDNIAIQKATIKINGNIVASFTSHGSDETKVNLSASTSRVTANSDGSYNVLIEVEDKAGNTANWTDTIKIDRTAPKITRFVFSNVSITGAEINGSNRYGFFSEGSPTVRIYADDGQVSSGLSHAMVTINGSTSRVNFVAGVATVSLPSNTKGFISAYALDRVQNQGSTERPDGYVSENSNTHVNYVNVSMTLPETIYKDAQGLPLYNSSLSIPVYAGCRLSGISSMRWGVGDRVLGRSTVDLNGNITGNIGVKTTDRNLVLTLKDTMNVTNNENNLDVWVQIVDRLGHVSEDRRRISIDTDAPDVKLTYKDGPTTKSFYSKERHATLTITERNFNKEAVKITGVFGKMGSWKRVGTTWSMDVVFGEEKDYDFSIDVTDLAGNKSKTISEKFTVDAKAPRIAVEFDNNSVKNKKYYKKNRIATITVVDTNFDESKVDYTGKIKLGEWKKDEKEKDTWVNTLKFEKDGKYSFSLKCTDKAGNASEEYKVEEFIIDTKLPRVEIAGVANGISYKQSMPISVSVSDINLDKKKLDVELKGKKGNDIKFKSDVKKTSATYKLEKFDKDKKFDDIYNLTVIIEDLAGNKSEEKILFSLNRYGSEFSDDNNIFGNYLNEAKDVDISETNLERLDLSKCVITILKDGKTLDISENDYSIKEQEEEFGWKYLYHVKKDVFKEDGTYQVQIYSVLYDGTDYSSASKEYTFMLDTTAPEVLITGVETGKTYKDYSREVTLGIRDLSGVKDIKVYVNGTVLDNITPESFNNDASEVRFTLTESPKMQNISVDATDMAGNNVVDGVNAVMLTTNTLLYTINQPWFKWTLGSIAGLSAGLVGLLLARRIKSRKKEKELAKSQIAEIEKARSSGSGSSGSSGSAGTGN